MATVADVGERVTLTWDVLGFEFELDAGGLLEPPPQPTASAKNRMVIGPIALVENTNGILLLWEICDNSEFQVMKRTKVSKPAYTALSHGTLVKAH